jgi:hypothetical protein
MKNMYINWKLGKPLHAHVSENEFRNVATSTHTTPRQADSGISYSTTTTTTTHAHVLKHRDKKIFLLSVCLFVSHPFVCFFFFSGVFLVLISPARF